MLRKGASCGEPTAAFSQVGEAPDRVDEVAVRRKLERVHTRFAKRCAERSFVTLCGACEPLAKTAIVRVDEQLRAALRVLQEDESQIRHIDFERIVKPHSEHFVPLRETR